MAAVEVLGMLALRVTKKLLREVMEVKEEGWENHTQ